MRWDVGRGVICGGRWDEMACGKGWGMGGIEEKRRLS